MKIVLVSQEYPPETAHGGIATQNYMRAHGLADLGHQVFVISHSIDNRKHVYLDKAIQVIRIPGFDSRLTIYSEAVRWLTYSAEIAVAIQDLHSNNTLDLIVFPEWGGEGYIHLLNQTQWNHIPTVVHIHGPIVMFAHTTGWPDKGSEFYRVATAMESTCLRLADAISSSSQCSAGWCVKYYGIDGSKIPVLYTGIDTDLFYPREVAKSTRPTIIFVGSIRRNKGVDLLVDAACRLAKNYPDLKLRILGRGEMSLIEELKDRAIKAECPDVLDLPGFIVRKELPVHLSQAHIFAGPSTYEGGPGNVYLEAMACGLPVVSCSGSGASDSVVDGKTGFLISPGDIDALVNKLGELLSDSKKRETMGMNASQYILSAANSKDCLKRLESFYVSVATQKSKPSPDL